MASNQGQSSSKSLKPRVHDELFQATIPELKTVSVPSTKAKKSKHKSESSVQKKDLRPDQEHPKEGVVWSPFDRDDAVASKNGCPDDSSLEKYLLYTNAMVGGRCQESIQEHSDEGIELFLEHLTSHGLLLHQAQASLAWGNSTGREAALLELLGREAKLSGSTGVGGSSGRSRTSRLGEKQQPGKETMNWRAYTFPTAQVLGCSGSLFPSSTLEPSTAGKQRLISQPETIEETQLQWKDLLGEIEALHMNVASSSSNKTLTSRKTVSLNHLQRLLARAQALPDPSSLAEAKLLAAVESSCAQLAKVLSTVAAWYARFHDMLSPFSTKWDTTLSVPVEAPTSLLPPSLQWSSPAHHNSFSMSLAEISSPHAHYKDRVEDLSALLMQDLGELIKEADTFPICPAEVEELEAVHQAVILYQTQVENITSQVSHKLVSSHSSSTPPPLVEARKILSLKEKSALLPPSFANALVRPLEQLQQEVETQQQRINHFFMRGGPKPTVQEAEALYASVLSKGLGFPSLEWLQTSIARVYTWREAAEYLEGADADFPEIESCLAEGLSLPFDAEPQLGKLKVFAEECLAWRKKAHKALNPSTGFKTSQEMVKQLLDEGKSRHSKTAEYTALSELLLSSQDWMAQVQAATRKDLEQTKLQASDLTEALGDSSTKRVSLLKSLHSKQQQINLDLTMLPESKTLACALKVAEWGSACVNALSARVLDLDGLLALLDSATDLRKQIAVIDSRYVRSSESLCPEADLAKVIYAKALSISEKLKKLALAIKKKDYRSLTFAQLVKMSSDVEACQVDFSVESLPLRNFMEPIKKFQVENAAIFLSLGIKRTKLNEQNKGKKEKEHLMTTDSTKISLETLQNCIDKGEELFVEIPELQSLKGVLKTVLDWTDRATSWSYKRKAVRRTGAAQKPTPKSLQDLLTEGEELPVDMTELTSRLQLELEDIQRWQRTTGEKLQDIAGKIHECARKRISIWVRKWDNIKAQGAPRRSLKRESLSSFENEDNSFENMKRKSLSKRNGDEDPEVSTECLQASPELSDSLIEMSDSEDDEEYDLDKQAIELQAQFDQLADEAQLQPIASIEEEWIEIATLVGRWEHRVVEMLGHPSYKNGKLNISVTSADIKALLENQPELLDNVALKSNRSFSTMLQKICKIYADYLGTYLECLEASMQWVASARKALMAKSINLNDLETLLVASRKGQFSAASMDLRRVRADIERVVSWIGRAKKILKQKAPIGEINSFIQEAERLKVNCEELDRIRKAVSQAKAWLIKVKKTEAERGKNRSNDLRELAAEAEQMPGVDLSEEAKALLQASVCFCLCRTTVEEGQMLKCLRCPDQFHCRCIASPWALDPTTFVCLRCRLRDIFCNAAQRIGSAIRKTFGEPPPEESHPRTIDSPPEQLIGAEDNNDAGSWAILAAMRTGIMSFQRSRSGSIGVDCRGSNDDIADELIMNDVKINQSSLLFSQQNIKRWIHILFKVLNEPEQNALTESKLFVLGKQGSLLKLLLSKAKSLQIDEACIIRDSIDSFKILLWSFRALWWLRRRPRLTELLHLVDAGASLPFTDPSDSQVLQLLQSFISKAKAWETEVKVFLQPGGRKDYDLVSIDELLEKIRFLPVLTHQEEVLNVVIEDGGHRYCICRGPNNGTFMVQCDKCDGWYHGSCVNINKDMEEKLGTFECPVCAKKTGKPYAFGPIDFMGPLRSYMDEDENEDSDDETDSDVQYVNVYMGLWPAFDIMGVDEKEYVLPVTIERRKTSSDAHTGANKDSSTYCFSEDLAHSDLATRVAKKQRKTI